MLHTLRARANASLGLLRQTSAAIWQRPWGKCVTALVALFLLSQLLQEDAAGQWIIIIGGIGALLLRISGEKLLIAALITLGVAAFIHITDNNRLGDSFAVYGFLLVCFAAVQMCIEACTAYFLKTVKKFTRRNAKNSIR